ncbi:MAG: hypothetical protein AAB403_13090 [Planctomycetota bacterium]
MNAKVATFGAVLDMLQFLAILAGGISWGLVGAGIGIFTQSSGMGFIVGALLGGGVGWLVGSYFNGVGYTLLSINEHLQKIARDQPIDPTHIAKVT